MVFSRIKLMQLIFDLGLKNHVSLLIKYGEFMNGEITAETARIPPNCLLV